MAESSIIFPSGMNKLTNIQGTTKIMAADSNGQTAFVEMGDVKRVYSLSGVPTDLRAISPDGLTGILLTDTSTSPSVTSFFQWDADSTDADDGATIIKPDSVTGAGRYVQQSMGSSINYYQPISF